MDGFYAPFYKTPIRYVKQSENNTNRYNNTKANPSSNYKNNTTSRTTNSNHHKSNTKPTNQKNRR